MFKDAYHVTTAPRLANRWNGPGFLFYLLLGYSPKCMNYLSRKNLETKKGRRYGRYLFGSNVTHLHLLMAIWRIWYLVNFSRASSCNQSFVSDGLQSTACPRILRPLFGVRPGRRHGLLTIWWVTWLFDITRLCQDGWLSQPSYLTNYEISSSLCLVRCYGNRI